jgi:hypothetical protein
MANKQPTRLYYVFVHYPLKMQEWHMVRRHLLFVYDSVVPRLSDDLCYLRQVLKPRPDTAGQLWEGFAFVFLDPGWTTLLGLLGLLGGRASIVQMGLLGADLNAGQTEIERRLAQVTERGSAPPTRERIITAGNLLDLLNLLDMAARDKDKSFYQLFAGGAQTLRYDAPKIIEAAVRIANVGCGIPLFRFDDDVIFYGRRAPGIQTREEREAAAETTAKSILLLCERYQETLNNAQIRYFVCSGGYGGLPHSELGTCTENDSCLLNGYATRVLQLTQFPERRNREIEDKTPGTIRAEVVKAFLEEIVELGANPFRQVVSGAGLCLSDGAILDLPPFSNMFLDVMWIDDHLKYALHDELGHFGRWTRTQHHYEARVSDARFTQLRHASRDGGPLFTYRDVKWHVGTYMLRLILGCVADSWLRGEPGLKKGTQSLDPTQYAGLVAAVPHLYAATFMDVIPGGWPDLHGQPLTDNLKDNFKQKLWQLGCKRLAKAVELWNHDKYAGTFLGLFTSGSEHPRFQEFKDFLPAGISDGLAKAVQGLPESCEHIKRLSRDISPDDPKISLEQALITLVDDFVEYPSLVEFWPFFVQSVRCFQNQHAQYRRKDLEWMFPSTYYSCLD